MSSASTEGVLYLDTSALAKLPLREAESAALRRALQGRRSASSRLVVVELLRAVRRREPHALTTAQRTLGHTVLLALSDRVLAIAAALDPPNVGSLDAIHLATALRLGPHLAGFISYDSRQVEAATSVGLRAFSPR